MRQHARAIDAVGAAGERSMGAFDGALSLLSQIDRFLFFYKLELDRNLIVCSIRGFNDPLHEQVEAKLR